jgi:hypothetical protein
MAAAVRNAQANFIMVPFPENDAADGRPERSQLDGIMEPVSLI